VAGVGNKTEDYEDDDVRQLTLFMDGMWRILCRKRAEEALRKEKDYTQNIIRSMADMLVVVSPDGRIVTVNEATCQSLNYPKHELIGQPATLLFEEEEEEEEEEEDTLQGILSHHALPVKRSLLRCLVKQGSISNVEKSLRTKNGGRVPVLLSGSVIRDDKGEIRGIVCLALNITKRKEMECRQNLSAEVVGILNDSPALSDAISRILDAIQRATGFEAVGIRLQNGDDFPYFAQNGFSSDFLLAENSLIVRAQDGGLCRDQNGNVSLECTCGLVISGQTDPAHPLFTPGGSFWTNDSLPLLDLPADQEPRIRPRNRCIHEGFCSVALIPIRANQEIVGLLQLNGRKRDSFTLETIRFFEGISSSIGVALMRKRAEEELRASETRLHGITDSAHDAILMMDPQGVISYWNPAAELILGYRSEEAIGKDLHDLLVPDRYLEAHRVAFPKFVRTGHGNAVGKTVELVARRKDGRETAVAMSLSAVSLNGEWHAVGILRDITDRKRAEEELRESKQRLDIAMDGAQMGAWYWDVAEDKRYFSDQTCSLLGINSATFRGTAGEFFAVIPPEDRETVKAAMSRTLDQDTPYESEYRAVWPDGSVHCITARGRLSRDNAGHPLKLSGVIWDITAQKRAENDLKRTVVALESANKALEEFNQVAESATHAKSEFLANMSHEIRTPMTAILGFAEVLLGEPGIDHAPPDRIEAIRTIQRNGQYLLRLINDILDLSKIEAGKLDVEHITCSPVQVLADVIALMRIRADAKNLPLKLEYVGGIPESIHSDPLRLRQVLINLVGNAIKFTETGSVRVVTRLMQRLDKPALLQFDVIDTGIGLSQQQITKLFKPFNQADSSTTRKFGGTGLGLTISKRLATMLGGDITISSMPGKGSTFSVTVETGDLEGVKPLESPVEAAIPTTLASSETIVAAIRLDCRILLAEDGPDNQRLIAFLLKKAGAKVTMVENGQFAMEQALVAWEQGQSFDVILMDMQMPIMDGYTSTRQLREQGYTGPIIALTAHAMAEDRQKCLDAGCDDYATKPIDRQKFLATVAHWMARSRTNDESPKPTTTESNASTPMPTAFVYSHLAADPNLGELVEMFVQEMPDRINALETEARSHNWQQLTRIAHQLKGAAGSYGFEAITPYAAQLEIAARDGRQDEEILSALEELLNLCRHMRPGVPPMEEEHCSSVQSNWLQPLDLG
jgi:PAS domain S-box-containing protein